LRAPTKQTTNRVTSYDVAKLAGVSQPTVSRAFTPGASITKDKRDRVLAAAKQLSYLPNSIARSLASNRSNIVAVIVGDMHNPFYAESLQAFMMRLQETGRHALAFTISDGLDCDDALMQALGYHVDGVVVTSAHLSSDLISTSQDVGIPIVLFNRRTTDRALASVRCDNETGAARLARGMCDAGGGEFLIIRGDPQGSTSRDRVNGFRSELEARGIAPGRVEEIDGKSSYAGSYDAILSRFKGRSPSFPDAIFAVNDIMAIGCADALRREFGLSIPGDIMLAGFDGVREATRAPYELTTIRQPVDIMVEKTLELLEGRQTGTLDEADKSLVVSGELIAGKTVPGLAAAEEKGGSQA